MSGNCTISAWGIDPKHAKATFEAMDTIRDNVVSGEDFLA